MRRAWSWPVERSAITSSKRLGGGAEGGGCTEDLWDAVHISRYVTGARPRLYVRLTSDLRPPTPRRRNTAPFFLSKCHRASAPEAAPQRPAVTMMHPSRQAYVEEEQQQEVSKLFPSSLLAIARCSQVYQIEGAIRVQRRDHTLAAQGMNKALICTPMDRTLIWAALILPMSVGSPPSHVQRTQMKLI